MGQHILVMKVLGEIVLFSSYAFLLKTILGSKRNHLKKCNYEKAQIGKILITSFREAFELKNITKSGKSPPGGGSKKHQKVQNWEFGLYDKRGEESQFSFFSQIQMHTLDTSVEEKIN